jgi:hypothetical protein
MLDYKFYNNARLALWFDGPKNLAADLCNGLQSATDGTFLTEGRAALFVRPGIYRTSKKQYPPANYNLFLDASINWTGSQGIRSGAEHYKLKALVS